MLHLVNPSTRPAVSARPRLRGAGLTCFAAALLALGCSGRPAVPNVLHTPSGVEPFQDDVVNFVRSRGARAQSSTWDGFALVGAKADARAKPGDLVTLTLYWRVLDDVTTRPPTVFVHARELGASRTVTQADHAMLGQKETPPWHEGDIVEDSIDFKVPANFAVDTLEVLAGLYEGNTRFKVESGPHEKDDRVVVATIAIEGGQAALPTLTAPKLRPTETATIDGVLYEPFWGRAERVGPFIRHDGRTNLKRPTYARLAWDQEHLYIAFECDDEDAFTPYEKRDDPLYNSEAVEIFIDADGDRDEYVELQAAPNDLQFDAAFKGGARKNFDTDYNADYVVKTKVNGTVNNGSDRDQGWVSEWSIKIASLKDIPAKVTVGTEWKINLFRLERIRRGDKIVANEASAWSSPLSGDFHNLVRFGTLRFGE